MRVVIQASRTRAGWLPCRCRAAAGRVPGRCRAVTVRVPWGSVRAQDNRTEAEGGEFTKSDGRILVRWPLHHAGHGFPPHKAVPPREDWACDAAAGCGAGVALSALSLAVMQKLLFALAALAATALVVALAWGVMMLFSGALALPRWAIVTLVAAVFVGAQILRWRQRRRRRL